MNRIHISELRTGSKIETPFTRAKKSARHAKFLAPCVVYPCRDTPKILSTGATLHLGPIRLHVENCECRAFKSSAQCQKFGLPCRLFSACRRGLRDSTCVNCWQNVWKNSVCFSSLISEPAPISPSSPLL